MSNDKVVGIGCDGQSTHREVVSRHCAVKLGTNQRHRSDQIRQIKDTGNSKTGFHTPGKTGWSRSVVLK